MKFFVFTLSLFLTVIELSATVHRVSPDPDAQADFATIQAAHDAASIGDTVFIEPTKTDRTSEYGDVTVVKRLVFLGPGFFINTNFPDLLNNTFPVDYYGPISTRFTFEAGSDGSTLANLHVGYISLKAVNNIMILKNRIGSVNIVDGSSDIIIAQNFLDGLNLSETSSNISIHNNIFRYSVSVTANIANFEFYNNLLRGGNFKNKTLYNNINFDEAVTFDNCILSNNIDARPGEFGFGTNDGNQGGFSLTSVLIGDINPTFSVYYDANAQLANGSPAIGAGFNGEDCGPFGGTNPYVLSGLPSIPFFSQFKKPGVASDEKPLQTILSVEAK